MADWFFRIRIPGIGQLNFKPASSVLWFSERYGFMPNVALLGVRMTWVSYLRRKSVTADEEQG